MFTLSIKLKKKHIIICCAALCIVAGGAFAVKGIADRKIVKTSSVADTIEKLPKAKINDDRIQIAEMLGWKIDSEPLEIEEVLIPEKFDEVYSQYNELQKSMGFDLSKHKGDRCKRYVYKVKNYDSDEDVVLNMIICKNKVIGGDVSSRALGGFMQSMINDKNT